MSAEYFYTVIEFAKIMRLNPMTVRNAVKEGRIQGFKPLIGKTSSWRIPHSEIGRLQTMALEDRLKAQEELEGDRK